MPKKRYAIVGAGSRSRMFARAIAGQYKDISDLVGICDCNIGRARLLAKQFAKECGEIPTYVDSDFDRMLDERKVESVIVTTKDCFHDKYITRALELGRDAVTEKPMTTDEKKCQRIIDAVKNSGRKLRVTFNYRYSRARSSRTSSCRASSAGCSRSISTGSSTRSTGHRTSAAGTGRGQTPAGSWSTRRRTTLIWSTGG